MKTKNKLMSLAGFTLVELLIVMLIVAILAIAMLPMYKKYMTKAKYTAEGLPILATVKTQVDLDIYDKSVAPGSPDTVYTWQENTDGFTPVQYLLDATKIDSGSYTPTPTTDMAKHIRRLIKEGDLQGKLIRPNHVFYACINKGKPLDTNDPDALGGDYAYAIGVFGDGNGLPQNTGVATMEARLGSVNVGKDANNGDLYGATILGTWENYDQSNMDSAGSTGSPNPAYGQIRFVKLQSAGSHVPGACEIPDSSAIITINDNATTLKMLKQNLIDEMTSADMCGEWTFPDFSKQQ